MDNCPYCNSSNVRLTTEGYQCWDCWRMCMTTVQTRQECAQCKSPFDGRSDAIYCSEKCRQKAHRRQNKRVLYAFCEYCGEKFQNTTGRAKFCSQAHKQAAYRERSQATKKSRANT